MNEVYTVISASVAGVVPGAVGGFCNVFVGHPIDLVKVRQQTASATSSTSCTTRVLSLPRQVAAAAYAASAVAVQPQAQQQQKGTIGMLRSIFVKKGVPGLYAGVSAPLIAVVPTFALTFYSYDTCIKYQLQKNHAAAAALPQYHTTNKPTLSQVAIAGGSSGVVLGALLAPIERIKCLMQIDKTNRFTSFGDCARQVYQEGGLRSVFRGTAVTMARDVPGNAIYFTTYEFTRRTLGRLEGRPENPSFLSTAFSGGCAGVANWIFAIPIDTVKSRWQTAAPGTYPNYIHVVTRLLATDGAAGFFRGLGASLIRAFPSNCACLLGFETAKSYLAVHR